MALKKTKTIHSIDWSYHKIIECKIEIIKQVVALKVAVYKDRNHRLASESDYVSLIPFTIKFTDLNLSTLSDFRQELYRCMKLSKIVGKEEANFYSDASDVLE